jgi:hypothetical protein
MTASDFADRDHLTKHAKALFPDATISIRYTDDESNHLIVNDVDFIFAIGSDDDEYIFTNGNNAFRIPLMDS